MATNLQRIDAIRAILRAKIQSPDADRYLISIKIFVFDSILRCSMQKPDGEQQTKFMSWDSAQSWDNQRIANYLLEHHFRGFLPLENLSTRADAIRALMQAQLQARGLGSYLAKVEIHPSGPTLRGRITPPNGQSVYRILDWSVFCSRTDPEIADLAMLRFADALPAEAVEVPMPQLRVQKFLQDYLAEHRYAKNLTIFATDYIERTRTWKIDLLGPDDRISLEVTIPTMVDSDSWIDTMIESVTSHPVWRLYFEEHPDLAGDDFWVTSVSKFDSRVTEIEGALNREGRRRIDFAFQVACTYNHERKSLLVRMQYPGYFSQNMTRPISIMRTAEHTAKDIMAYADWGAYFDGIDTAIQTHCDKIARILNNNLAVQVKVSHFAEQSAYRVFLDDESSWWFSVNNSETDAAEIATAIMYSGKWINSVLPTLAYRAVLIAPITRAYPAPVYPSRRRLIRGDL